MPAKTPPTTVMQPHSVTQISRSARKKLKTYFTTPLVWDIDALYATLNAHRDARKALDAALPSEPSSSYWKSEQRLYEDVAVVLTAAGFRNIHHLETVGLDYNSRPYPETQSKELRAFDMWVHPSGILAESSSSSQDTHGRLTYNGIHINAQVDIGCGRMSFHASNAVIGTSSSYDFQPGGGHVHHTSFSANRDASEVIDHLAQLQRSGHIKPFSTWETEKYITSWHPKTMVDVENHPALLTETPEEQSRHLAEIYWSNINHVIAAQPDDIASFLKSIVHHNFGFNLSRNDNADVIMDHVRHLAAASFEPAAHQSTSRFDWRASEPSLVYIERVASGCLERFWPSSDQQIIAHWTHLLSSVPAQPIDLERDFVSDRLTGGAHLGNLLVFQSDHCRPDCAAPGVLCDLLRRVDVAVLKNWCTVPDATGKTLPMQVVSALLSPFSSLRRKGEALFAIHEEIVDILTSRLSSADIVMETEQMSVWGMWATAILEKNTSFSLRDLENVLAPWKAAGVNIGKSWSYANPTEFLQDTNRRHVIKGPSVVSCSDVGSFMDALPEFSKRPEVVRALLTAVLEPALTDPDKPNSSFRRM